MQLRQSLLIAVVLTFSASGWAQEPVKLGGYVGLSSGNIAASGLPTRLSLTTSRRLEITLAAHSEVQIAGPYFLRGAVSFVQRGTESDISIDDQTGRWTFKSTYIDLPIALKIKLGSGNAKPYFFAGPSLGVILSARANTEFEAISISQDVKEAMRPLNFAIDIGTGFEYHESPYIATFLIEAAYSFGITNTADPQTAIPTGIKTRDFRIVIGWLYHL